MAAIVLEIRDFVDVYAVCHDADGATCTPLESSWPDDDMTGSGTVDAPPSAPWGGAFEVVATPAIPDLPASTLIHRAFAVVDVTIGGDGGGVAYVHPVEFNIQSLSDLVGLAYYTNWQVNYTFSASGQVGTFDVDDFWIRVEYGYIADDGLLPQRGSVIGGTPVTITGAGFDETATTSVEFGGALATSVVVVSATEITCITSTHAAGLVDVVVTQNGFSGTLADAFTYELGATEAAQIVMASASVEAKAPIPSKVTLDASIANDPDGIFDTFAWEQVSGPNAAMIHAATSLDTDVSILAYAIGTWVFKLTASGVTDEAGPVSISQTVSVVIPAPRAPVVESQIVAVAYPDDAIVSPAVDDDGWSGPVTYAWTEALGPDPATIVSPTARTTRITFPVLRGTWKFRLVASNNVFDGEGIVSVTNNADVAPPPTVAGGSHIYVTINGVER